MRALKVLGVHGLGDHRRSTWKDDWQKAVLSAFPRRDDIQLEFVFLTYDDIFEKVDLSFRETLQATWKLARSAVGVTLGRRGVLADISDRLRWTAGYVVAWVEDEAFKRQSRNRVLDALVAERPNVVLAHSLGSLVTYNAFSHPDAGEPAVSAALSRCHYVTLGSQIGNPFVVGNLTAGRVEALPVKYWYHLYNDEDDVFTAPIRLWDTERFRQVDTHFDIAGIADHSALEYLRHPSTVENVWRPLAEPDIGARVFGVKRAKRETRAALKKVVRPSQRALLVGINNYPQEQDRLEGCVNDVFHISSVLQECGFPPDSIRVCLDERATAKGIMDRLEWLLDDPLPGDQRVFFYSGHGARIPEDGANAEPDRMIETLVPWDFDWSPERGISDDQIFSIYSQLPYNMLFAMILDCCHSGGMHRHGGPRVRGLTPPDDIRHRELKWDKRFDMWVPRKLNELNREFSSKKDVNASYFGEEGTSTRLGRASLARVQTQRQYRRLKERAGKGPVGPYLPLIIEACQEKEFSYEYRHGVASYGAFTFSLALELRKGKRLSFKRLVEVTSTRLKDLGYDQRPQILGPTKILNTTVPWTS